MVESPRMNGVEHATDRLVRAATLVIKMRGVTHLFPDDRENEEITMGGVGFGDRICGRWESNPYSFGCSLGTISQTFFKGIEPIIMAPDSDAARRLCIVCRDQLKCEPAAQGGSTCELSC